MEQGQKNILLENIRLLEEELLKRQKEGKVSYNWFNKFFAEKLPDAATLNKDKINPSGNIRIAPFAELRDQFPDLIMMPFYGDIGSMGINRFNELNIHPIGVTGKNIVADGENMPPSTFTNHDGVHAGASFKDLKKGTIMPLSLRAGESVVLRGMLTGYSPPFPKFFLAKIF